MKTNEYAFEIWICMVLVTYLLGFIQVYAYMRFKSIQNLFIIQRRYPSMVMAETHAVLIYLFIGQPLYTNNLLHSTASGVSLIENIKVCAGYIILTLSVHFISWTETTRLWLIWFDLNLLNSLKNQTWKVQIDQTVVETDWFSCNKSKWGNKHYVIKCALIWYLITTPILIAKSCVVYLVYPHFLPLGQGLEAIFYSLPICITMYTYCKCPKNLNDNFFFHYEFRTTATIFGAGMFIKI